MGKNRRYRDDLAIRVSTEQRDFLEKYSNEHGVRVSDAARACIDLMMAKESEAIDRIPTDDDG